MNDSKQALAETNFALALAASIIEPHRELIDAFLEEERHVDSVMPILDPSLWMSEERRRVAAMLAPLYRSAKAFYDAADQAKASSAEMAQRVV